ncbi:hypothetical protein [Candidatus Poriferisodalis sp.]|uniref:hypothetical protein n=1 Tax=Candidatus Poriferisodalis sp. TaxID=3101277 RepID=UPI003B019565
METRQLESTPGFVIYDLPDAQHYVGETRLGSRLIPGNATMLVRHVTYVFAMLEQRRSGAGVGLKSDPSEAAAAVDALAGELADDFRSGRLSTSPGLRLNTELLAPVLAHDQRNLIGNDDRDGISLNDELIGVGAAAAAASLLGGLDGKRVAIEGFGPAGVGIAREAAAAGAKIVRIATAQGCAGTQTDGDRLDPTALAEAWLADGERCVASLSPNGEPAKPWTVWKDDVDVLFCGSKPGAMSGEGASMAGATPVVAFSAAAVSSKALAVLRAAGVPVVADFVVAAGPALGWWADAALTHSGLRSATADAVNAVMSETLGHDDGPFMAACYRAEAFLRTWQDELPFGRPLG